MESNNVRSKAKDKLVRNTGGSTETTVYIDGVFEHRYNSSAQEQTVVQVGGVATVRTGYSFDAMPTTTYQLGNHLGSVSIRLSDSGTILDRDETACGSRRPLKTNFLSNIIPLVIAQCGLGAKNATAM